jgi:malate dehydrogenase (oxaloacetate-decarboxylating)
VILTDIQDVGRLTETLWHAGGVVVALHVVDGSPLRPVVDITCNAIDEDHADALVKVVDSLEGARVRAVSDRTFLLQLGGKLEVLRVPAKLVRA